MSLDPNKVLVPISEPSAGSAGHTWMWRFEKPEINKDICTKCGLCWLYCPDETIIINKDGYPSVKYEYCKGCGICANECPVKAIKMVSEYGG